MSIEAPRPPLRRSGGSAGGFVLGRDGPPNTPPHSRQRRSRDEVVRAARRIGLSVARSHGGRPVHIIFRSADRPGDFYCPLTADEALAWLAARGGDR